MNGRIKWMEMGLGNGEWDDEIRYQPKATPPLVGREWQFFALSANCEDPEIADRVAFPPVQISN